MHILHVGIQMMLFDAYLKERISDVLKINDIMDSFSVRSLRLTT